jgi:hypothetical protein
MSKAIEGAAMLAGSIGMSFVAAATGGGLFLNPLYDKVMFALAVGGISMEAGAIAQALTQQRGQNITTRQPACYRQVIYGTQRVGGVIVYQSTTGSKYDQYNLVIVLATHVVEAIENLYLDGRRVYWAGGTGNVTRNGFNFGGAAGGGDQIGPNGAHYNFDTLVYCEARFGDQADGDVIGGLTANDPNWAASGGQAPYLGGCAYVYLKIEYDAAMFGQFPEIRFTVHGKNDIYDPRTSVAVYDTPNLQTLSGWGLHTEGTGTPPTTTPPTTFASIGGVAPTTYSFTPGTGGATALTMACANTGSAYADWMAYLAPRPILSSTGNLKLSLTLTPDASCATYAQCIEIDTIISYGGYNYNGSCQLNYAEGGHFQIVNAAGAWVDCGFNPGILSAGVAHTLVFTYAYDTTAKTFSFVSIELDGTVYTISGTLQNVPASLMGWATGVILQLQQDLNSTTGAHMSFTVDNVQYSWPGSGSSGYSTNAALICADILSGSPWGLNDSTVNQAQLIAAANVCDETVTCVAGSEARYAAHWHYDTSTPPGEALKVFLSTMGGRITRAGGEWFLWPAYWQGPSAAFDENILLDTPQWNPYRKPDELINRVNGTYLAPNYPYNVAGDLYDANGWYDGSIANQFPFAFQPTNFPQYAADVLHGYPSDQYLTEDGNYQLPLELELKAVLSVSQAQRLAKIALLRNRQQGSGVLKMKLGAFGVTGLDVITMSFAQLGWSSYALEVSGEPQLTCSEAEFDEEGKVVRAPELSLQVPVQDTSSTVYADLGSGEELTPYDVPSTTNQAPYIPAPPTSMTLVSGAATAVEGADGVTIPRVLVEWTDPADILAVQVIIQFQLHAAGSWQTGGIVPVGDEQAFVGGVVAGVVYDFRICSLRANGAVSEWLEQDSYTVSATLSIVKSTGLNPNSPFNVENDAVLDSIVDGSGSAAEIRIYGPGGIGTAWDNYTGQGSATYPAASISGLAFSSPYTLVYDTVTSGYLALATYTDALSDSYIMVGWVTTCASGGTGSGSGGGGGTGAGGGGGRGYPTV